MRERTEVQVFTQRELETLAKWAAKSQIVGSLFIGDFISQVAVPLPGGSLEIRTRYVAGSWEDREKETPR